MNSFFKSALFFKIIVIPVVVVFVVTVGIFGYLKYYADNLIEKNAKDYSLNILKTYKNFSKSSIEKGQRHSFQEVVDGLKNIDGVKDVYGFSRDGFMMYRLGEKSVGLPFVKKDEKFFNPNNSYFEKSNGLWMRSDWFYKNITDSKITECMYKKIHPEDKNCARCHHMVPKDLEFKKRVATKQDGDFVTAYYDIPVENDCIKCHTHWQKDKSGGYLAVKIDLSGEKEKTFSVIKKFMFCLGGLVLIVVAVFIYNMLIVKKLRGNLVELKDITADLAEGEGDLTKRVHIKSKDEAGDIAKNLNTFIEKIQNIISNLRGSISTSSSVGIDVEEASKTIKETIRTQSDLIEKNSKYTDEMRESLVQIQDSINYAAEDINSTHTTLEKTVDLLLDIIEKIKTTSAEEVDLSHKATELAQGSTQIKEIIEIIKDIADQTNLLALNAAIEAARAGEHGRGFAVVADEVRKLAEKTQKSTNEIDTVISIVLQGINTIEHQIQENSQKSLKISETTQQLADETNNTMQNLDNTIKKTQDAVKSTEKIESSVGMLVETSSELTNQAEVSREVEKRLSENSNTLKDAIKTLEKEVDKFKV
jgi:methyl-accepting chemotaxis protein